MPVRAPLPPRELAERVGPLYGDDLVDYDDVGRRIRDEILHLLPADWTFQGKSTLDFGCGAGRTLRHFVDEAESCTFYGCDIDRASIEWLACAMSPPFRVSRTRRRHLCRSRQSRSIYEPSFGSFPR